MILFFILSKDDTLTTKEMIGLILRLSFSEWPRKTFGSTVSFSSIEIPKKCLEDLTTFFMSTWWGDSKIWKKLNSHDGFLSYLQNSTASQFSQSGRTFLPCLSLPSKSHRKNSISPIIFGIPSSIRHEKCCQILQTLFWVFQCSRNSQWTTY